ncbi:hypothetical protein [Nocardia noduli]|uniref:hypothetical protein n=1 Tax=Nocardia noduli TaxID=2815722 RepID=UPI001C2489CF|nr:hypothetical protein [Nocardia noduli]
MSDRSTEDEIRSEVRQFAHSLPHLLRLLAQSGSWLDRRHVRKQISRTLREQRRAEEASRTHHLSYTQQMVDRYRDHALTVSERANDPSVDHERRYRDHQILTEHANNLRHRIAVNDRLTVTERGIALDGLDAATTFPRFEPGRLFKKAHKVRGIEALKYRAQVARVLGADTYTEQLRPQPQRQDVERRQYETGVETSDLVEAVGPRDPEPQRGIDPEQAWETTVRYHRPDSVGPATSVERGWHRDGIESAQWASETVEGLQIKLGTEVSAAAWNNGQPVPEYLAAGTPDEVREQLAEGLTEMRQNQATRTGDVEQPTPPPPDRDQKGEVAVEPDRLAAVEQQLADLQAHRDRLGSRVQMLQRGLDAVTSERDEIRRRFDTAEAQVAALKTRNQRLAAEIGEVRDRTTGPQLSPGVAEHVRHIEGERDQARRERDRFKAERDEAVRKLARSTPERERFGSRERIDQQHRDDEHPDDREREQAHEQAIAEWNETVGRNMAESLADLPDHPEIAKRDLGRVDWSRFTDGTDNADELARWWAAEGAEQYWAEHDAANVPEHTQGWQPEQEEPRPERNGHRRNGIERSR